MSAKTYLRFVQTADVYSKTVVVSPAGQKTYEYSFLTSIPVHVQSPTDTTSSGGDRRLYPYQDFIATHEIIVPGDSASYVDYQNRIFNIKDRYGNQLEAGPFEIVQINPKFGFNGKKHHVLATIRKVVEAA